MPSLQNDTTHNMKRTLSFRRTNSSFRNKLPHRSSTSVDRMLKPDTEDVLETTTTTASTSTGGKMDTFVNWIEDSMDFLACAPEGMMEALNLKQEDTQEMEKKFAKLHEQFFESLLKEQVLEAGINSSSEFRSTPDLELVDSMDTSDYSVGSGVSSSSSITWGSNSTISASSTKTNKRRRTIKDFYRLSPKRNKRIAPIEAYNRKYNPELSNRSLEPMDGAISLEDLAAKNLEPPSFFLSPRCQLQKDKGKGMAIGSFIVAEGANECLERLRQKMKVVIQVSGEERKAATSIKRKVAKVSQHTSSYIETRSTIELRLGFLSLQYGLLLRWDHQRSGKAVFCLLRKMCHDSFYTKTPDLVHVDSAKTIVTRKETEAPPFVVRTRGENHAIYQRIQGTEVVYVDPPFRVPQPDAFEPSIMTLQILSVDGLTTKSKWSISVTYAGHTEMALLQYQKEAKAHKPKRLPMVWDTSQDDPYELEIRMFESTKRKMNSKSTLYASMTVPISHLVAQPTSQETKSWQLTVPLEDATLKVALNHRSNYTQWLYKELDVRRLEEVKFMSQTTTPTMRATHDEHAMDWLWGLCCNLSVD